MKKGYTKAWRKEIDSDIWLMPPLYHRVFFWLRQKAPWKFDEFPTQNKMNIYLNAGQLITSMGIIAEGVSYMENNVKKIPQRKTIQRVLEWLEFHGMIALARHRQGTTIFILNWDTYQSKQDSTCHSDDTSADTEQDTDADTHLKKEEEIKEDIYIDSEKTEKTSSEGIKRKRKKPSSLRGKSLEQFDMFWDAYPKKVGIGAGEVAWLKADVVNGKFEVIMVALEKHKKTEQWQNKQFIPNPSTWINQRRWLDEIDEVKKLDLWEKPL